MAVAADVLAIVEAWLYGGLVVAAAFLAFGLDKVDESARGAFIFRAVLVPGIVLLWPVVLWRWVILARGRDNWAKRHRPPLAAHGRVWSVLAAAIPLVFLAALLLAEPRPSDLTQAYAPERLSEPRQ